VVLSTSSALFCARHDKEKKEIVSSKIDFFIFIRSVLVIISSKFAQRYEKNLYVSTFLYNFATAFSKQRFLDYNQKDNNTYIKCIEQRLVENFVSPMQALLSHWQGGCSALAKWVV
jgi:hypothetical protein